MDFRKVHIILYVRDQNQSCQFYSTLLGLKPSLNVPGMTEFELLNNCVLGIMPEAGIKKLLGAPLPNPASASGVPRAELYLVVTDPEQMHTLALKLGAKELSPLAARDWGHEVAYSMDPDGHVLAFARTPGSNRLLNT